MSTTTNAVRTAARIKDIRVRLAVLLRMEVPQPSRVHLPTAVPAPCLPAPPSRRRTVAVAGRRGRLGAVTGPADRQLQPPSGLLKKAQARLPRNVGGQPGQLSRVLPGTTPVSAALVRRSTPNPTNVEGEPTRRPARGGAAPAPAPESTPTPRSQRLGGRAGRALGPTPAVERRSAFASCRHSAGNGRTGGRPRRGR